MIVTLFVNPRQFNSPADLAAYPRTEAEDAAQARAARRRPALRARRRPDVPAGLRHHRLGRAARARGSRRLPARPFRRRRDRRGQAPAADRRRPRLLRREGLPAARCWSAAWSATSTSPPRSSAARPCASPTAWRSPRATSASRPTTAPAPRRSHAALDVAAAAHRRRRAGRAGARGGPGGRSSPPDAVGRVSDTAPRGGPRSPRAATEPARLLAAAWLGGVRLIDNVAVSAARAS